MTRNKEIKILCDALHKFGTNHQIDKTLEEFSELSKALLKHRADNTKQNHFNIVDEIVDCEIMIEQMKIVFCNEKLTGFKSYEEQREFKLNRLKERISQRGTMKHKSMNFKTTKGRGAIVLADINASEETKEMIENAMEKAYLIEDNPVMKKVDCHACQGGGCPVCSGFGYYYN